METLINSLIKTGAPWGLLCAALALFVAVLWRQNLKLSDRVFELAMDQIRVNTETRHTLDHVQKDLTDISRRFKTPR
jgi:hypothetical protein